MSASSAGVRARLRQPVGTRTVIGGTPQVSLLPTEVREAGAVSAHRRRLVGVVVVAAVVAVGAVVAAQNVEDGANARLADANAQTGVLTGQLAKFDDVRALESQIALGRAGVQVASSTMIDWQNQIDLIEADMPAGYAVTDIAAVGATPMLPFMQGATLLEPTRAATVTMTITTGTVGDEFSVWLRKLRAIPAYADATATTILDSAAGVSSITLTLHLTAEAISSGIWTEQP